MARINEFELAVKKIRNQEPVKTTYSVSNIDDELIFQIDTYGRDSRKVDSMPSQTIQFNKTTAIELISLLKRTFEIE
jgi:hypothetical protein